MPRRRLGAVALAVLAAASGAAACDRGGSSGGVARDEPAEEPLVYVAVGASDAVGVGATDRGTEAWPVVFRRTALSRTSEYTNLGVPGTRVEQALADQVPPAVAAEPDVVTVWLAVNDLTALVDPARYGEQLRQLVRALRRGGETIVLVGNTPELDSLPSIRGRGIPAAIIEQRVDEYNAQIADVVEDEGAVLVDLHARSERLEAEGRVDSVTASDGFHPNTDGHAAIAAAFADAYADVDDDS